jgi:hypothetical protein
VVVNGTTRYRLVPGTAADGLLLDAPRDVDFAAPFGLAPAARTIQFTGLSGALRVDLYSMRVRIPTSTELVAHGLRMRSRSRTVRAAVRGGRAERH